MMEEEKKRWELIVESKLVTHDRPLSFFPSSFTLPLNDEGRHDEENASRNKQATSCSRSVLQQSSSGLHAAEEEGAGDLETLLCDITIC